MKPYFTIFALILSTTFFAQNKINAFAGVNYSYFTNGVAGQILAEESFGLRVGASYEIELNEKISFRPAIVFDQVGDRTKTEQDFSSNDINQLDLRLSYINIPLDFKFWNRIYLFGGPQIGFLVSKDSSNGSADIINQNVDLGLNLGTGFTVNKLFFEFAIYQGLTSLGNYQYTLTGNQRDIHNGYAKFTIGYNIK